MTVLDECPPPDTGLFPDEDNCMKYFQCYEGTAEQKNCDMRDGKQLLYDVGNKWVSRRNSNDGKRGGRQVFLRYPFNDNFQQILAQVKDQPRIFPSALI